MPVSDELRDKFIASILSRTDSELESFLASHPGDELDLITGSFSGDGHTTAMGLACAAGSDRKVKLFLKFGAPYDIYAAAVLGDFDSLRSFVARNPHLLLARAPYVDCRRILELHLKRETVQELIKLGAEIDATIAAIHDLPDELKVALESKGKALEKLDRNGRNGFHVAVSLNRVEITKILLAAGINPNVTDSSGSNAMCLLPDFASEEMYELLRQSGCEINWLNQLGLCPLSNAIFRNLAVIAKRMVRDGATIVPGACFEKNHPPLEFLKRIGRATLLHELGLLS